jgi:hypothetical protein
MQLRPDWKKSHRTHFDIPSAKIWTGWREALIIVKPETVIAWHRQAFHFYWRWLVSFRWIGLTSCLMRQACS